MKAQAMAETEYRPENIESPCISVCALDPGRTFCIGCYRTIDEIKRWRDAPAAEKERIKAAARARYLAANGDAG